MANRKKEKKFKGRGQVGSVKKRSDSKAGRKRSRDKVATFSVAAERSKSLWMDVKPIKFQSLTDTINTDVVIIGSGVAGLSTAYELTQRGSSVVVLDRGQIARGISARTTAHLAYSNDETYAEVVRLHGKQNARACFESQKAAIDRIEKIIRENKIACDFKRTEAVLFAPNDEDVETLKEEIEACHTVGFSEVGWTKDPPVAGPVAKAIRYPNQAHFHPIKYLDGLARILKKRGVQLFERSNVWRIEENETGVTVETETGIVKAEYAVIATNSPITDAVAIHTKQAPYRSYAFAAQIKRGAIPDVLYWDTLDPYHYVRLQPGNAKFDYIIVGGEDHKSGLADDADERFQKLERWAREYFPSIGKVTHRWSGQVMDTIDALPYIGLNPGDKRTYFISGDSGQGWTNGTLGGMIVASLVKTGRAKWADLNDVNRVTPRSATRFISENSTAMKNFAEYVLPGDVKSVDSLKNDGGAVITEGGKKVAAYRDKFGKLHRRSAVCTHLGCLVHWNSFERCWDCPCHGSQFGPTGDVYNGPAITPLAPVEAKK